MHKNGDRLPIKQNAHAFGKDARYEGTRPSQAHPVGFFEQKKDILSDVLFIAFN